MTKRKAWRFRYRLDQVIFTGLLEVIFLHEPTIDEVLHVVFEGKQRAGIDAGMVKHWDRIVERHYKVDEIDAWHRQ